MPSQSKVNPKPKRQKPSEGDVFVAPLMDGSNCAGQLLKITPQALNSYVCAFFDVRVPDGSVGVELDINACTPFAVLFVTPESLKKGHWPICGNARLAVDIERYIPLRELEANEFIGTTIVGSGIIRKFLNAYYGMLPWDDWHDPEYLDKLLVARDRRPANVIWKKS
jgi:hypothetical protein